MAAGGIQTARREVREDLRAWFEQFGETPTARELEGTANGTDRRHAFHDRHGHRPVSYHKVKRAYGSLNQALRAARLPRRRQGERRSPGGQDGKR